ncbi:MAG TPA: hypothetical protein PK819_04425 [Thermomicrobiales bacterium]|nr:hypothetical protein [Thermomicrobiales bacterium]
MPGPNVMRINGVPVPIHSVFRREVPLDAGQEVTELELVIMIRGRLTNKQFIQHISKDQVRLDWDEASGKSTTLFMWIVNHTSAATGEGETAINRHDISLREDPAMAKQRRAAIAAEAPVRSASAEPQSVAIEADDEAELAMQAPISTAVWGDAIRQLKNGLGRKLQGEPLTQTELVAVETVLINLRIDALIDQLDAAGVVRRASIDERFQVLVKRRFVEEATPLVGSAAARRAVQEME